MAGLSSGAPREGGRLSGATLSLIAVAVSELRRDLRLLLDSRWDEAVRRRAEELSSTLELACRSVGLKELQPYLRAAANLMRISREMAIPVLPALQEKFRSLGNELESRLPRRSGRSRG